MSDTRDHLLYLYVSDRPVELASTMRTDPRLSPCILFAMLSLGLSTMPPFKTIASLLLHQAKEQGEKIAFSGQDRTIVRLSPTSEL